MDRITVRSLYKIFGKTPDKALRLLEQGAGKQQILAETGHVVGLDDISLSIPAGAIYMIMGLSGSGKSTLARCLNRLIEPTAGQISIDGQSITGADESELREIRRTRISMVFQHFALLPNRSVIENAEFGLKLRGVPARERRRKAEEVLSIVGLSAWAGHLPGALSGGMRQRVGLARALATDADVLIMDEAFSALDPLIRSEMQDELLRLQRVLHKTVIFITHDFQEALKLGSRIALMAEGRVVQEAAPTDIVLNPANDYVAAFTRDVDRARLFDAGAAAVPALTVATTAGGGVAPLSDSAATGAWAFALDEAGKPVGLVATADMAAGRARMTTDFAAVSADTKLVDVAAKCRRDRPLAVLDDGGRLRGQIEPADLLPWISSTGGCPAPQANKGV